MTAPASPWAPSLAPPPSAPATAAPPAAARRRRWHRFAIPFGLLLLAWLVIGVAHVIEQPSLSSAGTLSPTGTGPDGSSRLATMLADRGQRVVRVSNGAAAVRAAESSPGSTIFLPTPNYLSQANLSALTDLGGTHRIVVVRPSFLTLLGLNVPIYTAAERWAAKTVTPDCTSPFALRAGAATVARSRYLVYDQPEPYARSTDCYRGSVVGVTYRQIETIVVGATDPFRNSRIDESGNAALATGLLGEYDARPGSAVVDTVIWVDAHAFDPVVQRTLDPGRLDLPDYDRGDQDRTQTGYPTLDAFPQVLWATLLLLAFVAVLMALAWARRLGPPVAEPLPVLVPAAESVTGRGRLYDRIGARGATLDALRTAAITRLARLVNPFGGTAPERDLLRPGPAADAFVEQLAGRTGLPAAGITATLYGPEPDDDGALAAVVADLDTLVNAALRDDTGPAAEGRRTTS